MKAAAPLPQSLPKADVVKRELAPSSLPAALADFYQHHFMPQEHIGDDEAVDGFADRLDEIADRVRRAPCQWRGDLFAKLRVFEVLFFEDGGDFFDGRELAWIGSLKADIVHMEHRREKEPSVSKFLGAPQEEETDAQASEGARAVKRLVATLEGILFAEKLRDESSDPMNLAKSLRWFSSRVLKEVETLDVMEEADGLGAS